MQNSVSFIPAGVLHTLKKFLTYGKTVKIRLGPSIFPISEALITEDYNLIEFVLSSNKFLKKSANYYFLRSWLGNGLLVSSGKFVPNLKKSKKRDAFQATTGRSAGKF